MAEIKEEAMMRLRKSVLAFGLTIGTLLVVPAHGDAQAGPAPRKGHISASDGVNYYYEIHGQGQPLLLLHGGLFSIDMFGPILPALARQRQVIAVDLQRSEEHTSELQSPCNLVCRLLLEKKKKI